MKKESEADRIVAVNAWAEMFERVDASTAKEAVMRYAQDNPSAFAPSASEVYGIARKIRKPKPMYIPESTDAPCAYGFCDGRGFELYTKYERGYDYEYVCWCPCEFDRKTREARCSGADADRMDFLCRERDRWESRMRELKGQMKPEQCEWKEAN
jgi:hypothetical protein